MNIHFRRVEYMLACFLVFAAMSGLRAQTHGYPDGGTGGEDLPDAPSTESDANRLAAIRQNAYSHQIQSFRRLTARIVRSTLRAGLRPGRGLVQAGPAFKITDVTVDTGYSAIKHMNVTAAGEDAEGYNTEAVVGIAWKLGDQFDGGLELTHSRTYIRGPNGWETETQGGDAYLTLTLNDYLALGVFGTAEQVDVENVNGNGFRYTGGGTVNGMLHVGNTDFTASLVLAGTSEDITRREYDTLLCTLLDAESSWTDTLSTSVFLYGSDSIRQDMPGDRTFWSVGADVTYTPTERWGLVFGYEKTLDIKDFREDRLHVSLRYSW